MEEEGQNKCHADPAWFKDAPRLMSGHRKGNWTQAGKSMWMFTRIQEILKNVLPFVSTVCQAKLQTNTDS